MRRWHGSARPAARLVDPPGRRRAAAVADIAGRPRQWRVIDMFEAGPDPLRQQFGIIRIDGIALQDMHAHQADCLGPAERAAAAHEIAGDGNKHSLRKEARGIVARGAIEDAPGRLELDRAIGSVGDRGRRGELDTARIVLNESLLAGHRGQRLRCLSVGSQQIVGLDIIDAPLEDRPVAVDIDQRPVGRGLQIFLVVGHRIALAVGTDIEHRQGESAFARRHHRRVAEQRTDLAIGLPDPRAALRQPPGPRLPDPGRRPIERHEHLPSHVVERRLHVRGHLRRRRAVQAVVTEPFLQSRIRSDIGRHNRTQRIASVRAKLRLRHILNRGDLLNRADLRRLGDSPRRRRQDHRRDHQQHHN